MIEKKLRILMDNQTKKEALMKKLILILLPVFALGSLLFLSRKNGEATF
jgi:hypothetical protein